MVYAYYRKSEQSKEEEDRRNIYKWADSHKIRIDEFVCEDLVSKKKSSKDSAICKEFLSKLEDNDTVIFSDLSGVGKSASELDNVLNHSIQKPIRLVCVATGWDINFKVISPLNKELLRKISFAARLQSILVREVTQSALLNKKLKGVGLGAANKKYRENFNKKTQEEKNLIYLKRGKAKNDRYLNDKSTVAFLDILRDIFKNACYGNPIDWDWRWINTKGKNKILLISKMREMQIKDATLFPRWQFNDDDLSLGVVTSYEQTRLAALIEQVRRSIFTSANKDDITPKIVRNKVKEKRSVSPISEVPKIYEEIDDIELKRIEKETMQSQELLSDIFDDASSGDIKMIEQNSTDLILDILRVFLTKEKWSYDEVNDICKKYNMHSSSVLEQINDYSYSKVNDSVIEDNGSDIDVITDYKQYLI